MHTKEQVQELNDELGEMEVWDYMRSVVRDRDWETLFSEFD